MVRSIMTPTEQLLLCLARLDLTEEKRARAAELARQADWGKLVELALAGGIAGLVGRNLEGLDAPREPRLRLVLASLRAEQQNRALVSEAVRLCAEAEAAGLTLIPLKGCALNLARPYAELGLRSMCDLDLLAPRQELEALGSFLLERGYRAGQHQDRHRRFLHHLGYLGERGGEAISLELHWTALHVMFSRADEDRGMLARAERWSHGGAAVRVLGPEDSLLVVALHLAVHRFRAQLKWLVDVAELARFFEGRLDWAAVWERARRVGGARSLAHALGLAAELLQAPVMIPAGLGSPRLMRWLGPAADLVGSRPQPALGRRLLVNLLQYDSPLGGLRYLLHKGAELLERHDDLGRDDRRSDALQAHRREPLLPLVLGGIGLELGPVVGRHDRGERRVDRLAARLGLPPHDEERIGELRLGVRVRQSQSL
jgi:hypothetical protein